jgi:DNA-binding transcriptional LysR family regulator
MQKCMNWKSIAFDWNQARAFLVTAEEGSLSAAAQALGLTQPTLGRQVAALEKALGVTLFERVGRTLVLTPSGVELLDHVRGMGDAANRVAMSASGRSQAIEGQVSITASDLMSAYSLPRVLLRLRDVAPGIEVEIVASNMIRDLTRREADIAIRHVRPEQPDLIAKRVGDGSGLLCASAEYLEQLGQPTRPEHLTNATFIEFDRSGRMLEALNGLGLSLTRGNFKYVSDNGNVVWQLVKQGLGIAVMPADLVHRTPGVASALPDLPPIRFPTWLVTHRELHTNRSIRLVFDLLADEMA